MTAVDTMTRDLRRRRKRQWLLLAICAAVIVVIPAADGMSVASPQTFPPLGYQVTIIACGLAFLALLTGLLATPFALLGLCLIRFRPVCLQLLMCVGTLLLSLGIGVRLGQQFRMAGMRRFAERARVVTDAIHRYQRDHVQPPAQLANLVPNYLPEVPTPDMTAFPDFQYFTGDHARRDYHDNPWVLRVFTPRWGINFDCILYFPNQNYPESGYSGTLERVGDWAYVHE